MHRTKKIIFGLFLLVLLTSSLFAESINSQLKTLEVAVNLTIERLESGIGIEMPTNDDFVATAGQQLQLALLGLNAGHLLQEDYYHFSLYLIARHLRQYLPAINLLKFEYDVAEQQALKNWLQKRIKTLQKLLQQTGSPDEEFSIPHEFSSLRNLLKNFGLR